MPDIVLWLGLIAAVLIEVRLVDGTPPIVILLSVVVAATAAIILVGLYTLGTTIITPPPAGKAIFGWLIGLILLTLGAMALTAGLRGLNRRVHH